MTTCLTSAVHVMMLWSVVEAGQCETGWQNLSTIEAYPTDRSHYIVARITSATFRRIFEPFCFICTSVSASSPLQCNPTFFFVNNFLPRHYKHFYCRRSVLIDIVEIVELFSTDKNRSFGSQVDSGKCTDQVRKSTTSETIYHGRAATNLPVRRPKYVYFSAVTYR